MKKIIVLLIMLTFVLSSCSIDWNDKKDKRIIELENKVEEIRKEKESDLFYKKQECKKYQDTAFLFLKEWDEIDSIFYSKKLNSCLFSFITYETVSLEGFDRDYPIHVIRDIFTLEYIFRETDYPLWQEKIKELKWE